MVAYAAFGYEYLSRKVYPIRNNASVSGFWTQGGTRTHDLEGWGPSVLPTELLASKNNYKTIQDIVVGGSSELQKTSTEMILINNELDIFL